MTKDTNHFDWGELSTENLKITQKVIRITLNFLQLQPTNSLSLTNRIPLQKFENEQLYLEDVSGVLNKIDGIEVTNVQLLGELKEWRSKRVRFPSVVSAYEENEALLYLPSEEELKNYVFLQINSLDELHQTKDKIDYLLGTLNFEKNDKDKKEIPSQANNQILTAADKKKLCILEKLKEEWDLVSKKNNEEVVIEVSWQRNIQWQGECGIDDSQFENILQGFKDENLLDGFRFFREQDINPGL